MEALEAELAERAEVARTLIDDIRESLESQVAATVRAAEALTEVALGGVADRLPASRTATPIPTPTGDHGPVLPMAGAADFFSTGPSGAARGPKSLIPGSPMPPTTYQPPVARTLDGPAVWEIETR
jgi:hypothetical protein